jgi:hypothetical protein
MAKMVLVWHDISELFVEIDERHLAHPILGPHYHIARVNSDGKPYIPQRGKSADAKDSDKADN